MKLAYTGKTLTGISVSSKFDWTKDSLKSLEIDWPTLEKSYTEFQVKVWRELVKIPWGETRTYKQVAASIGNPNAYRAVANACGANPLALLIPCHRVIATTNIGGYRWNTDIKKHLLEQELLSA